jgi:Tfp pilus assembly protein PilN
MTKQKRWHPKKIIYVSVQNRTDGMFLSYIKLHFKEFSAAKSEFIAVDDLATLIKKEGKFTPFIFHFKGQGVLTRCVENAPNYKESLLVNGAVDEFYFHSFTSGNQIACSFLRKSLVFDFMEEVKVQKLQVLDLYCGPISLFELLHPTGTYQKDFHLTLHDSAIQNCKKNEGEDSPFYWKSAYLNTDQCYIASAQKSFFENQLENMETALVQDEKLAAQTNSIQFNQFRFFGIAILVFFLLTLTGNYFYINHLNQETAQLESDISSFNQDLSLIEQLKQEKTRKMQLIQTSGIHTPFYLSNLSDLIGHSVPSEIKLVELEIFPLEENLKPKMKVSCLNDVILIHGISQSSKSLDDWMEKLENLKGITAVELLNYIRINEKTAEFQLSLKISE